MNRRCDLIIISRDLSSHESSSYSSVCPSLSVERECSEIRHGDSDQLAKLKEVTVKPLQAGKNAAQADTLRGRLDSDSEGGPGLGKHIKRNNVPMTRAGWWTLRNYQ